MLKICWIEWRKCNNRRNFFVKAFSKLSISQKKVSGWLAPLWNSLASPNNSTCGSKIREKLSKKWAHDFMQEEKCSWRCVAGAAQERKAQHESMEATYVRPSVCFGTVVLRTKNIVPGKIIPEMPSVSIFQQIYLISWWCLCGHNFCFSSSHSGLLSHAWPERSKVQVRTWG